VAEFLPAVIDVLDANSTLEAMIVGSGECEAELRRIANGHARVFFVGSMSSADVMEILGRTQVFFSGCDTEAFGISLLEAAVSAAIWSRPARAASWKSCLMRSTRPPSCSRRISSARACRVALEAALAFVLPVAAAALSSMPILAVAVWILVLIDVVTTNLFRMERGRLRVLAIVGVLCAGFVGWRG
jgi:hypothetical protein